jgi:hypothetical protein
MAPLGSLVVMLRCRTSGAQGAAANISATTWSDADRGSCGSTRLVGGDVVLRDTWGAGGAVNISATTWSDADRGSRGSTPCVNSVDTRANARISGVSSLSSARDTLNISVQTWSIADRGSNGSTRFVGEFGGTAGGGNGGCMTSHTCVIAISSSSTLKLFQTISLSWTEILILCLRPALFILSSVA